MRWRAAGLSATTLSIHIDHDRAGHGARQQRRQRSHSQGQACVAGELQDRTDRGHEEGRPTQALHDRRHLGVKRSLMPSYTAQMGHWTEQLVDEVAARLGPDTDRERLLAILRTVGAEMEMLAGQSFGEARRSSVSIATFGLPFVELPGLLIGSEESTDKIWAIPNPVDRQRATVVQVREVRPPNSHAMPIVGALRFAGGLVHRVAQSELLSRDYLLRWLQHSFQHKDRVEFMRGLVDASNHVHVPIAGGGYDGWWFQITRRLLWVTKATEEQRLVEPLISDDDDALKALVAVEPLLIAARVTNHPADWVMAVRIWPSVERAARRPWRILASAIHAHGIPILTLDPDSTSEEIQCQLLLHAYWHRYIDGDEPEMADVVASAYPRAVERIARATGSPDRRSAAAVLLEGLLHPGFDPAVGAAAGRRYVSRKATIAILNHRKTSAGGLRPWEVLGVTERRYYKLLKRFARKTGARYDIDASMFDRIRDHLTSRDQRTEQHTAALELLQGRGFSYAAARKWLQRHAYSDALKAWPRHSRSSGADSEQVAR